MLSSDPKSRQDRQGILVLLEKRAGFHLITTILAIAKKKKKQFSDPGTLISILIAAIAATGEKVT